MKCSGDSEILNKIVCDTTRISSCFSDFRVVPITNYFVCYLGIPWSVINSNVAEPAGPGAFSRSRHFETPQAPTFCLLKWLTKVNLTDFSF